MMMLENSMIPRCAFAVLTALALAGCSSDAGIGQSDANAADGATLDPAATTDDRTTAPQAGVREPNQQVSSGGLVILDGTTSRGEHLAYAWDQVFGTAVELSDSTGAVVTFRAPAVGVDRVLIFRLTVTDLVTQLSSSTELHVTITPASAGDPVDPSDGSPAAECATAADCGDGSVCNGAESCVAGACQAGIPLMCDDGLFCTGIEGCDAVLGCTSGAAPCDGALCLEDEARCMGCVVDADCDDANACTDEVCADGACSVDVKTTCPDGETCDALTGLCSGSDAGDGPVVAYRFDEGTGTTVFDVSGRHPPMDLMFDGAVSWSANGGAALEGGRIGTAGSAAKLIGALTASDVSSFEILCTPAALDQAGPARLLSVGNDSGDQNFVLGQINGDLQVRLLHSGKDADAKPRLSTADSPLSLDVLHIVHTYDGTVERLYIDGTPQTPTVATTGTFAVWDANDRFNIGNEGSGDRPWAGVVYYVAVHDQALTAGEVADLHQTALGRLAP